MKSFDEDFSRMKKLTTGIFIGAAFLVVVSLVGAAFLGIFVVKEVKDNGLKGIIEEVWEGESEK